MVKLWYKIDELLKFERMKKKSKKQIKKPKRMATLVIFFFLWEESFLREFLLFLFFISRELHLWTCFLSVPSKSLVNEAYFFVKIIQWRQSNNAASRSGKGKTHSHLRLNKASGFEMRTFFFHLPTRPNRIFGFKIFKTDGI